MKLENTRLSVLLALAACTALVVAPASAQCNQTWSTPGTHDFDPGFVPGQGPFSVQLTVRGADGGNKQNGTAGGSGATITTTYSNLTANKSFRVYVGTTGENGQLDSRSGGGGGGSSAVQVVGPNGVKVLVVAAAGGGGSRGGVGGGGQANDPESASGGGAAGAHFGGAGGGGYQAAGADVSSTPVATGGGGFFAPQTSGAGGVGYNANANPAGGDGGAGWSGGGGSHLQGGGGGGGWLGGNGSPTNLTPSTGGDSHVLGTTGLATLQSAMRTAGTSGGGNNQNGSVTITCL